MGDKTYAETVSRILRTWPVYLVKATVFTVDSRFPRDLKIRRGGKP